MVESTSFETQSCLWGQSHNEVSGLVEAVGGWRGHNTMTRSGHLLSIKKFGQVLGLSNGIIEWRPWCRVEYLSLAASYTICASGPPPHEIEISRRGFHGEIQK